MRLVLDGTPKGKRRRPNKRLERFHRLRERLQRKQREVERFERDLDALMEVYRTEVLPVEAEQVRPMSRLADRLTVFMSRRSLGARDRDDLADWFWETVSTIRAFRPELAETLSNTFEETVAHHAGLTKEELDELIELHVKHEREFEERWQQSQEGTADEPESEEQYDFFGFDDIFEAACRSCGRDMANPRLDPNCADWCQFAPECLGKPPENAPPETQ